MKLKEYSISREMCLNMANPNSCCSGCGGELEPIETVDNAGNPTFWLGCTDCQRFDWGVDKTAYQIAYNLVVNKGHVVYSYMGYVSKEDRNYPQWLTSQVSGTVSLVRSVLFEYKQLQPPAPDLLPNYNRMYEMLEVLSTSPRVYSQDRKKIKDLLLTAKID